MIPWEESHGLFEDSEYYGPEIGLPVEGQLFWRPLKFVGIGLYGVVNINAEKTCASLALNLQFGNLR